MAGVFEKASMGICAGDGKLTEKALEGFNGFVPRIVKGVSGKLERGDMERFDTEMKHSGEALRAGDWEAFTNHLESGMIATKALFVKKTDM